MFELKVLCLVYYLLSYLKVQQEQLQQEQSVEFSLASHQILVLLLCHQGQVALIPVVLEQPQLAEPALACHQILSK